MGFEKEVKACTDAIRNSIKEENFQKLSIILAAATTGGKLTDLVKELMKDYITIGFETESDTTVQVPSTIEQMYTVVPTANRIHTLLAFLFCKRASKVMVFMATCQCVNFFYEVIKGIDWKDFGQTKKDSIK